jgi:organic hydroperoxide reductase OsmC/OhrA
MEVFVEPKRAHKSFHFRAKTTWSSARRAVLSAAGKPNIVVGSPPEFKGEPDIWAPEELLVASLNTCTMLTFLTLAQTRGLTHWDMKAKPTACSRMSMERTELQK